MSIIIDWKCVCCGGPRSHYTTYSGEKCYGWCQHTSLDCAGMGYRPIEHSVQPAAWKAMLMAIDSEWPRWPSIYTVDLSSDMTLGTQTHDDDATPPEVQCTGDDQAIGEAGDFVATALACTDPGLAPTVADCTHRFRSTTTLVSGPPRPGRTARPGGPARRSRRWR